jgi:hypothetical protein
MVIRQFLRFITTILHKIKKPGCEMYPRFSKKLEKPNN